MNHLFVMLGIESWKPVLTALALPPVPLLLLILIGARLILPRRGLGWLLVLLGATGVWLSACAGTGELLTRTLGHPPALGWDTIAGLKQSDKVRRPLTIVVLGGGREKLAPEYGTANLNPTSLARLRYGLWLARETGATVGFSGGVGWASEGVSPEAEAAERIARADFGQPLQWTEIASRDTRENAIRTVALLNQAGVKRALLVTHGWHMPRALRLFEAAAAGQIEIMPAPMGLASIALPGVLNWLPSTEGFERVRVVLRELLGGVAGA